MWCKEPRAVRDVFTVQDQAHLFDTKSQRLKRHNDSFYNKIRLYVVEHRIFMKGGKHAVGSFDYVNSITNIREAKQPMQPWQTVQGQYGR
jgi:hypothetical protein